MTLGRIPARACSCGRCTVQLPRIAHGRADRRSSTSKDEDELIRIATHRDAIRVLRTRARSSSAARHAQGAQVPGRKSVTSESEAIRTDSAYRSTVIVSGCPSQPSNGANPLLDGLRIEPTPEPTALVIFGASGDLTRRKLLPALYHLSRGQRLPARFNVLGVARSPMTDDAVPAAVPRQPQGVRRPREARRRLVGARARHRLRRRARWTIPALYQTARGQADGAGAARTACCSTWPFRRPSTAPSSSSSAPPGLTTPATPDRAGAGSSSRSRSAPISTAPAR